MTVESFFERPPVTSLRASASRVLRVVFSWSKSCAIQ